MLLEPEAKSASGSTEKRERGPKAGGKDTVMLSVGGPLGGLLRKTAEAETAHISGKAGRLPLA